MTLSFLCLWIRNDTNLKFSLPLGLCARYAVTISRDIAEIHATLAAAECKWMVAISILVKS